MENGVEATIKLFRLSYTGAIVVPPFSGFGIDAIVSRLSSCGARAIIATTGYHRRGRLIETAGRDTRNKSGKEMRRVIRSIYRRLPTGGLSSLYDPSTFDEIRHLSPDGHGKIADTIMPHSALMDEISNGALVLVPIEPSMRRTAYLMKKRNRPVTRASSSVGKLVSVILKDMLERRGLRTKRVQ